MRRLLKGPIPIIAVLALVASAVFILFKERLARPKAVIAIIIDDWGYRQDNFALLARIKRPLGVSVLPGLKYSESAARTARKHGHEVLLHLPMESQSNDSPEPETIYCAMDDDAIAMSTVAALESIPGARGVNNHQGSRATEDERVMRIVLSELKSRRLFFVDSLTTGSSVCPGICGAFGLGFAQRDVFLDLPATAEGKRDLAGYIRGRIFFLARQALRRGSAVGIGHDKKITMEIICETVPEIEKLGIKIVPVSALIRSKTCPYTRH